MPPKAAGHAAPQPGRLRRRRGHHRKGVYTLWTILFIPVLAMLFILAVNVAQLWLARVELENALEAAALAAVKEWGDANGGSTWDPRHIGVEYAAANTINGIPVEIDLNYDPSNLPNENASCDGNLVFGAVIEEPGDPCFRYIFNAGLQPSCALGEVLIDASGQGSLRTANLHEWGIAFHRNENTPDNLRIKSVTLDFLEPAANDAYFLIASFGLADDVPPFKVTCDGGGPEQPDIFGFTKYTPGMPVSSPNDQIQWTFEGVAYGNTRAKILKFNFYEDPSTGDPGFEPCDRFRFGVKAVREDTSAEYDGDEVGFTPPDPDKPNPKPDDVWVTVTIEFSFGVSGYLPPSSPQPPTISTATAILFDNTDLKKDCDCDPDDPYDEFCPNSLIVHPTEIPDLPCPPADAAKNNGQSYVVTAGEGLRHFGVRAQATIPINSLLCRLCGDFFGPFNVSACTTAMYHCEDRRPRLIRVEAEDFICPGP